MGKKGFVIKADGANPLPWNLIVGQKVNFKYDSQICTFLSVHSQIFFENESFLKMLEKCECGKPCKTEDEMEGICDNYGKCSQDIDKPNCTDWWPGKNSNYFHGNLLPSISTLWRNDLS